MRTAMSSVVAALSVGLVSVFGVGCSSSDDSGGAASSGAQPDFTAIAEQYDSPTGTYDPKSSGPVLAAYSDRMKQQSDGSAVSAALSALSGSTGASSATVGLQSAPEGTALTNCQAGATAASRSCSCPNGGTVSYEYSGSATSQSAAQSSVVDALVSYKWSACAMTATSSIDGSMYFQSHVDRANAAAARIIVVMKLAVKKDAATATLDLSYSQMDGKLWFVVQSSDGYVAVSGQGYNDTTKSGTMVIKDKNDTYTCTFENGKGSCTGAKSGATVDASTG